MLYSCYSKKEKEISTPKPLLSTLRMVALSHLGSSTWYSLLEGILPENWEETYDLELCSNPEDVLKGFKEELYHRDAKVVSETKILSYLASKKEDTVPGKYTEHKKRDNEYPYEANRWTIDQDKTEFVKPIFHVNHRLIWITGSREINFFSEEDISKLPLKYTIHIYTPEVEVLTKVEHLKFYNLD